MRENEFSVNCLCADAKRPTMWSHYSDGHSGVCVHLDAKVPPFYLAYKVVYQDQLGKMFVPPDLENRAEYGYLLQQMFLLKNTDWAYEQEHRFLPPLSLGQEHVLAQHGTRVEGLDLYFPPARILGVTLGALMDDATQQELLAAVADRGSNIPVFKARLGDSESSVDPVAVRLR